MSKEIYQELARNNFIYNYNGKGTITKNFNANLSSLRLSPKFSNYENEIIEKIASKKFNQEQRNQAMERKAGFFADNLIGSNIITYDKLLEKSKEIIEDKSIARIVANRLAYVFVDEYQDTRLWQHEIFMKIFEQNKSHFYCIGDPLQSIFKFTYTHSQNNKEKSPQTLQGTPIFLLENKYGKSQVFNQINHRSSPIIVDFIHNYLKKLGLQQDKYREFPNTPIYFIDCGEERNKYKGNEKTNIDFEAKKNIINLFNSIKHKDIEKNKINSLVLVEERQTIKSKQVELNVIELSKDKHKESSYFKEISRCVLGIVGYKISQIIDKKDFLNVLKYRKFCLHIIKEIQSLSENERIEYIRQKFKTEFLIDIGENAQHINITKSLEELTSKQCSKNAVIKDTPLFFSTIHSAKGLEATNVLVIAKTKNELERWLEFSQCNTSSNDNYRLGYVAFSRARNLLCIACLEKIDQEIINKLNNLGIKILPEQKYQEKLN